MDILDPDQMRVNVCWVKKNVVVMIYHFIGMAMCGEEDIFVLGILLALHGIWFDFFCTLVSLLHTIVESPCIYVPVEFAWS